MTNYVSREAAINATKKMLRESDMPFDWQNGVVDCLRILELLPAADVREVKRGVWCPQPSELEDSTIFVCSNCGHMILILNEREELPYCGNCGADMRGTDDAS